MPRGLFVTGTDTGIGKTFVSCGILRALARRGVRVAAYKPAETGCARRAGSLVGADCALLAEAANIGLIDPDATVSPRGQQIAQVGYECADSFHVDFRAVESMEGEWCGNSIGEPFRQSGQT